MAIVEFLNRQITVPTAPNLQTERLNPTYVPEVGNMGIDMDGELSEVLKDRLSKMANSFPYDGMTPEELGALRAMKEISGEVANSAKEYVETTNKIGTDMVQMYGAEAQHKANFLKHDLAVKQVDEKHVGTLGTWQQQSNQIVNSARAKVAYLKAARQAAGA
ncbi:MAG: hypothetical protein ACKO7W_00395 [Elainella sp.]